MDLWFDEEPPADVFSEGLTRTNVGQGSVWVTFTLLLGMSEVVRRFPLEPSPDRNVTTMTLDDVDHYTTEKRPRLPLHICRTSARRGLGHSRSWLGAHFPYC